MKTSNGKHLETILLIYSDIWQSMSMIMWMRRKNERDDLKIR
jgi:hypothetical protein